MMYTLRAFPIFSLVVLAACEAPTDEEGKGLESGETASSALVLSSVSPSSDVAMSGIWAGGGSAPIYGLMDDGVSFAASDRGGSFARSAPARASSTLTLGYHDSARPGGASRVVVNYDGWAINGGAGSLRVKLYEGAALLATGPTHVLTNTPANFSDTFADLDVTDAKLLRTELIFENSAAAGSLVSSIIWLDVTSRSGTGLQGQYFDNIDFTGASVSRVDSSIDFDWGATSPASGISADTFSVRWTGKLSADHTETYTLYTTSDDGVRLTVNGTRIIDNWTNHGATENFGAIDLQAGHSYDIVLEYFENTGNSVVKLSWSSSSTPKSIIPKENLFPGPPLAPIATLTCPVGFPNEVFRDDFDGAALDNTKWNIIQGNNNPSGGAFTQLTKMLRANVKVEDGKLKVSSKRHCEDPYPNVTPEHPARCAGTNYYSGAWLKGKDTFAPGKGVMAFHAKLPAPMPGTFPALWARNSFGDARYGELDLVETWWDSPKGIPNDPNKYSATTHLGMSPMIHTTGNEVGPFANLVSAFHVWEVEWDADAVPAVARYYYRDSPSSSRILVRVANYQTPGFNGRVTDEAFRTALSDGWRPYIDFAVQPEGNWNVGPDAAAVYDPQDLEVDSVIICAP
ncbi:PA14 domain-containing protein [Myxococcus sp. Y35]|uniref:PA14 domain-containing protein n=1 Tax=Pseudomyxococcus flavus TaxID=3115648 RepID=UPI003CF5ECC2